MADRIVIRDKGRELTGADRTAINSALLMCLEWQKELKVKLILNSV